MHRVGIVAMFIIKFIGNISMTFQFCDTAKAVN